MGKRARIGPAPFLEDEDEDEDEYDIGTSTILKTTPSPLGLQKKLVSLQAYVLFQALTKVASNGSEGNRVQEVIKRRIP
jgi:hypothetical protein